ncbi:MAG: ABC transporter permease [Vicinamibacteria bacterium]|nr:ABC transporter permease [Vicinamibacteria bacterium]
MVDGPAFVRWRAETLAFRQLGAYRTLAGTVGESRAQTQFAGAAVTPELLAALGVSPIAGRWLAPEDTGSSNTALVSEILWRALYGDTRWYPEATLLLDGNPVRIAGVMPRQFEFPDAATRYWTPLDPSVEFVRDGSGRLAVSVPKVVVVGRLRSGVEPSAARAEARRILEADEGEVELVSLASEAAGGLRVPLAVLGGAGSLALLAALSNLSLLIGARAQESARAIGVRIALGATWPQAIRDLVLEGAVLGGLGGLGALPLAWANFRLLELQTLPIGASARDLAPAWPVLAATPVATALVGALAALAGTRGLGNSMAWPSLSGTGSRYATDLYRPQDVVLGAQVVLAMILASGAAALATGAGALLTADPGLRADGLTALDVRLDGSRVPVAHRAATVRTVVERLKSLPAVQGAGATSHLIDGGRHPYSLGAAEAEPAHWLLDGDRGMIARIAYVDTRHFELLAIPILHGRGFSEVDRAGGQPVAVLSKSVAAAHFGGPKALGQLLKFRGAHWTIVGVAGDVRPRPLDSRPEPLVYLSYEQASTAWPPFFPRAMTMLVRARAAPPFEDLHAAVHAVDPSLLIEQVSTLAARRHAALGPANLISAMLSASATLAFVLALLGVAAQLARQTAHRQREIGTRLALGARPSDVVRMVVWQGLRRMAVALLAGLPLAAGAAWALQRTFLGPAPAGQLLVAPLVGLCLFVAGALAAFGPGFTASRISPASSLRTE